MARVQLSGRAEKAYKALARADRRLHERVRAALRLLGEDPEAGKSLHGELAGRRSYRVGQIRILYRFEAGELLVLVLDIAQLGRVYRAR